MKSKLLFLASILFFYNTSSAQVRYGILAGANISNWKGDALKTVSNVVDLTRGFIDTKSNTGFHFGCFVNIPIANNFSFEPGLQYSKKGYDLQGDLKIDALKFLGVNAKAQVNAHYIDMPLVVKANVAKGFNLFVGPQVSYLIKNNFRVTTSVLGINVVNKNLDITNQFNKLDVAMVAGLGYQFNNGLFLKSNYDYGLSKLDKNKNIKAYNRVVKISLGFNF
jgi:Outer membrane protein beta-barrel domain